MFLKLQIAEQMSDVGRVNFIEDFFEISVCTTTEKLLYRPEKNLYSLILHGDLPCGVSYLSGITKTNNIASEKSQRD